MTKKKPLQLDHVSYSGLSTYRSCPHHFWLRYSGQTAINAAARISNNTGSAWHEWQESYAQICHDLDVPSARSEGLQLARTYDDPEIVKLAENFCEAYRYEWQYRTTAAEVSLRVPLPDGLPDFVGRIDCLEYDPHNERLVVTDFKTPRLGRQADEPPLQLRWYAWAVQEARRIETGEVMQEIELVLWIVPSGEAQTWMVQGEQVGAKAEIVMLAKEALGAKSYPATPSERACAWCPYKSSCKAIANLSFSAPTSPLEAGELMGRAEAHRAHANDLTALVQAWVKEHGGFERGGSWHDYQAPVWYQDGKHRYKPKDAEELFAALEQAGLKPWDFLAFDQKKLGKAFHEIADAGEPDPENPFGDADSEVASEALQAVVELLEPVVPNNTWGTRTIKPDAEER